ncbi:DUF192 domain-containing protein [Erythrobacter sp. WH131]|uniref:DUF192 domain-containing protein n=2 Tax=Erythrobacter ani TaxID=2827235 RepID=A0ABS6SJB1_9SPHN|nr:DUF192 domain-containing protein [Erythrobacter ani]
MKNTIVFDFIRPAFGAVALLAAACAPVGAADETPAAPPAAAEIDRHPVSGLEVIDLVVVSGQTRHPFRVEVAATPQEQNRGLMFRTEMGENEGMFFPSYTPQARSFWMKNTPMSLDIIFIGTDGRITNIAANTVPYSTESVPSTGLTSGVLELIAGRAAELGIEPGDEVMYTLPDGQAE